MKRSCDGINSVVAYNGRTSLGPRLGADLTCTTLVHTPHRAPRIAPDTAIAEGEMSHL